MQINTEWNKLDNARDVRDLVEKVELSFVKTQSQSGHRLLYQFNDVLQLLANLL